MNSSPLQKATTLILLDIDDVLFDTAHFKETNLTKFRLFEEVIDTVKALVHLGEVGILSQGTEELQLQKLINTGIHQHFIQKHIHIVASKDERLTHVLQPYAGKHKHIFFVDDRLYGLYFAKQALPEIVTIWLQRGRYAHTQEPIEEFSPDKTIHTLAELPKLISQYKIP